MDNTPAADSKTYNIYQKRQENLARALETAGFNGLALNPGPSLVYLTGLHFHISERPVIALFLPPYSPIMILPELEKAKLENISYSIQAFTYGEDPATWGAVFAQAVEASGLNTSSIGIEPLHLRLLEYSLLQPAAPRARFSSAEACLSELRMQKDESELNTMRMAVQIAQQGLLATLPKIKPGVSELQIASELTLQLIQAGSESQLAFSPIVSSGPNSANPHAAPSERLLASGDLLVIDWGASYQGYVSDLTRTFAIGTVEPEYQKIAQIVLEANSAGRQAGGPGKAAEQVDMAARAVIDAAGYGPFFFHRTGHGLGMEVHEPPYMRSGNQLVLLPGMTYTVEPGIYLGGRGGVRIEDDVVITDRGSESLSDLPRQLINLG